MRKLLFPVLLVLAVGVPAASAASSLTVTIKKSGFSPKTATVAFDTRVTWKNSDKTDHQVVANDGSFASPVLKPGRSYSFTFTRSGTFHYHDALHPSLKGTLKVNGPPPSLTLALDRPIVVARTQVMLSGKASNVAGGTAVTLYAQEWGQPSPVQLAVVQTAADGTFGYLTTPHMYTTYTASFQTLLGGTVKSNSVLVQVEPKVTLVPGRKGWMHAQVKAGRSLAGRHLFLQRLSRYGQWVNVKALRLGSASGVLFRVTDYVPKGPSRIRVSLSVNQAGIGLLGAHSGTQLVHR
ncbi:MAG TPA: cupredoxin domain-containing protein [Gaiellaceae bacterium]|nr:cupredoxin domain-containing protein [Gaiellaceae bacterium]